VSGGAQPRWGRDGRELFFVSPDRHLIAVAIRTSPALSIGQLVPLFRLPEARSWKDYDVAADHRFLAIVTDVLGDEQPLTVVTNWKGEVK
jgi:hypothetical protein